MASVEFETYVDRRRRSLTNSEEASTGFEPVMRVLQTLALPLGHDAVLLNF